MGLMSIGLNLETNIKIGVATNTIDYYLFISSLTILFYLFAYQTPKNTQYSSNIRTQFYISNQKSITRFNIILLVVCVTSGLLLLSKFYDRLLSISWFHYIILGVTFFLSLGYYSWKFGLSLRKYTWFKPSLIAWTWAMTTVYLPLLMLELINEIPFRIDAKFYFLFVQTFMYFIVNAIIFDMKDFEDDTNRGLKTFVVRYGNQFMLNRVILPLIFMGFLSFITFGFWYDLPFHRTLFMLIPIVLLALFAKLLNRPQPIMFYLIAIDGMILIKAIFGILSVILFE